MSVETYYGIDYAALHYLLWCRRSTPTTVAFKQATLAAELRVASPEMSKMVTRLVYDGRLAKTSTQGVYLIVNPAEWTTDLVGAAPRQITR